MEKNFVDLNFLHQENFHVIVLTETFIITDLELFKPKGYARLYNNGAYNRNDGVVYVRDDLLYVHRVVSIGEVDVLEVEIELKGKIVKVTGVYRSPHMCQKIFNAE